MRDALLRAAYAALVHLARAASAVALPGDGKLVRSLIARRGLRARYAAWGLHGRQPSRALLWMHAPSVGEGLQARPVLELLRRRHPELQLAYTHFSPSAERFAAALDVDFRDYLPLDARVEARAALDALRPRALVFAKLDVWPALVREAALRNVALGLVSATLAHGSGRVQGAARRLLQPAYARLDLVGAIDEADAERLVQLGVRSAVIEVTGDTRYDQVWQRTASVDLAAPLLSALSSDRPTVVAGSTWPADEAVLLPAWIGLRRYQRDARLIIAPHEPTPSHLASIRAWAARENLVLRTLSDTTLSRGEVDVVVVDRVGVLGDLYAVAAAAYVGGGFHRAGLHSVLEPAAFGVPVLFGPRFHGSRDALLLRVASGGIAVSDQAALVSALARLLGDDAGRRQMGEHARAMVRAGLGAAERSYALVERLIA